MSKLVELCKLFEKMEQGKIYIVHHEQLYDDPKFVGIVRDSVDLMHLLYKYHEQHFSCYKSAAEMTRGMTFDVSEISYGVPFNV